MITISEECDDNNTDPTDGCHDCQKLAGYTCVLEPSQCYQCPNGKLEGPETCDDNNTLSGDGCFNCTIELGYSCVSNATHVSVCALCGNGRIEGSELCDDNNTLEHDGCSSICTTEQGWVCHTEGTRSFCDEICGNSVRSYHEQVKTIVQQQLTGFSVMMGLPQMEMDAVPIVPLKLDGVVLATWLQIVLKFVETTTLQRMNSAMMVIWMVETDVLQLVLWSLDGTVLALSVLVLQFVVMDSY